jgi:hypothetical protein
MNEEYRQSGYDNNCPCRRSSSTYRDGIKSFLKKWWHL